MRLAGAGDKWDTRGKSGGPLGFLFYDNR